MPVVMPGSGTSSKVMTKIGSSSGRVESTLSSLGSPPPPPPPEGGGEERRRTPPAGHSAEVGQESLSSTKLSGGRDVDPGVDHLAHTIGVRGRHGRRRPRT